MGSQMTNNNCSDSVVFDNFTAVEVAVKTGHRLTGNEEICFTFRDNFTSICLESTTKETVFQTFRLFLILFFLRKSSLILHIIWVKRYAFMLNT